MGDFRDPANLVSEIQRLRERVSALANSRGTPQYTTATRPAAAAVRGLVIFNATTGKHEGSDGTNWNALYP